MDGVVLSTLNRFNKKYQNNKDKKNKIVWALKVIWRDSEIIRIKIVMSRIKKMKKK